ncbi:hypothetical protein ACFPYI_02355 [Halomarina salina]|uniref:Uncharacterized protein n=1 Tax=Halomarina salina TaxID=1872699 RepID=A0ABD5RHW9_9EURY|nr:hypothetical protein [Halomarina salina]
MSEERVTAIAERTGRLLDEVNLQVEQFDAADERTAFLGYVGHADDPEEVLRETAAPVVGAFAAALDERDWPEAVDGLVVRAYDPTEAPHRREGALEWEVSTALAGRYAAGAPAEELDESDDTESLEAVVAEAVGTARMRYADGRVEPLSLGER